MNCDDESPAPVKSSSNVVFIFVYHVGHDGYPSRLFKLKYKAVEPSDVKTPSVEGCGDIQVALNSTTTMVNITSPGYPHGYDTGLDCNWTISSVDPAFHPVLFIVEVDLEDSATCAADYLQVILGFIQKGS